MLMALAAAAMLNSASKHVVHAQEDNFLSSSVKSFGVELDSGRAVAAGARLGWDVRGQNRRGRAAPCRACVLLYLPSYLASQ